MSRSLLTQHDNIMFLRNWATLYTRPTNAERALEPAVAAIGRPYRAQHPFFDLRFIVDFALLEDMTVVEVDGKSHTEHKQKIKDVTRTLALMKKGWRVVRIWNDDALQDPAGALSRALRSPLDTREELEAQLRTLTADGLPSEPQETPAWRGRDRSGRSSSGKAPAPH